MLITKLILPIVIIFFWASPLCCQTSVGLETANEIAGKIYSKTGWSKKKAPTIEVVKNKDFLAEYDAIDNKIRVGIGILDVCNKLKKNAETALAIIVGHEIDHFFKNPDTGNEFAKFSTCLSNFDAKEEAEADINGLFYAYLAGYAQAGNVYDDLVKDIYAHFKLPEIISGYPTLSERLKINEQIKTKADNIFNAFEMGNYLALMGNPHYEKAIACYEFVLKNYQGAEVNNNLAITLILTMIDSKQLDGYYYPLVLMANSQLKNVRSDAALSAITMDRLKKTVRYFDKVLEVSPSNVDAQLGKISIDVMLGNFRQASAEIDKLLSISSDLKFKGKLEVIKAIILIKQDKDGSKQKGKNILLKLSENRDPEVRNFASKNLAVLSSDKPVLPKTEDCRVRQPATTDNITGSTDFLLFLRNEGFSVSGRNDYSVAIQHFRGSSKLMVIQDKAAYGNPVAFQELTNYLFDWEKASSSIKWKTGMGDYTYLPDCKLILRRDDTGKTTCIKIFSN